MSIRNHNGSEVESLDQSDVFGVVVDDYIDNVNPSIRRISLIAEKDDSGEIGLDVIDSALNYITAGCEVILEVEPESDLNPSSLIVMASTSRFNIALLPPVSVKEALSDRNQKDLDDYIEKVKGFCTPWLNNPMSKIEILPFSGYFGYLVASEMGYKPEKLTDDAYMQDRFVDQMSHTCSEYFKDRIHQYIIEFMGGEQAFKEYAHTMGQSIFNQIQSHIEKYEA